MLAHYHGQIWNAAELARSMGVGENAVRHYLDVLSGAFMVRQLPPWFENLGKRLVFFYRTHAGAELDLLIVRGTQRYGFEFKFGDAPRTNKSMHTALEDLKLDKLFVIYRGARRYALDPRIDVLPLGSLAELAASRILS